MGFLWDYSDKDNKHHKQYLQTLRNIVLSLINDGYRHFISGGAIGADQDFAEIVIELKQTLYPDIQLEIAIPCPNQDLKWNYADKKRYERILSNADIKSLICPSYTRFCMQKRNEYMINNSSFVIAVWNGENKGGTYNTLCYARQKHKDLVIIPLDKIYSTA